MITTDMTEIISAQQALQEIRTLRLTNAPYRFKYELAILCEKLDTLVTEYRQKLKDTLLEYHAYISDDGKLKIEEEYLHDKQEKEQLAMIDSLSEKLSALTNETVELTDCEPVEFDASIIAFSINEMIILKKFIDFRRAADDTNGSESLKLPSKKGGTGQAGQSHSNNKKDILMAF